MKQVTKKLFCLMLALVVGLIPTLSARAATESAKTEVREIQAKISTISSNLSEAKLLEKTDIQDLVDYQIETYIATEYEAEGKLLSAGETATWIPLADLDGACFAYLVPLVDQTGEEVGYITMGAIEDGFTKYMLAWDTDLLESYRKLLDSMLEAVPVFFQPMQYGYLINDENGKQIFLMSEDGAEAINITESVAENAEQFTASYRVIRSSENAERIRSSLVDAEQLQENAPAKAKASVAEEDVRLSCEWQGDNKFVPIYYNNKTYYGGTQEWYSSPGAQNNGCGPVAAANILYYMSTKDNKYKALYNSSTLNHTNFVQFMNLMYHYVNPAPFGETSLTSWASDILSYASDFGVTISSKPYSSTHSQYMCASYIKNGLKDDKPVGALNLAAQYGSGALEAWHWVTITKYYQSTNNNRWIAISSMGARRGIDWDAYYANMTSSVLNGGFAYFY